MKNGDTLKLSKCCFGLSLGTLWGLAMFLTGLLATYCDYGVAFVKSMGSLYLGFEPTLWGSFIGLIWGFVDFFIFGFLIALFYNWYCCWCSKCCKK